MSKGNAFIWHSEWNDAISVIVKHAPSLAFKLYEAIRKYGTTGEDTELDWQAIGLFNQVKGDIDRARARYENTVEAGKKGGAKPIYDVEKAKQMVLKGASTAEIVAELDCSPSCARYYKTKFSNKNTENVKNSEEATTTINNNNLEKENEMTFPHTFAHEIYLLYQASDLPLPKSGEVGFLQYDMKKALENIKKQHLLPNDVIEAVKNYAKVLALRGWYNSRLSFDRFTRKDMILRFIPDRFNLKTYTNKQFIAADEYDGRPW